MAYAGSEGVEVTPLEDGGFQFTVMQRGRPYYRVVGPNDLVTQVEAGALLGVNRATVFKWIRDGKLGYVMLDGFTMISLPDLRDFAANYDYTMDEWEE